MLLTIPPYTTSHAIMKNGTGLLYINKMGGVSKLSNISFHITFTQRHHP